MRVLKEGTEKNITKVLKGIKFLPIAAEIYSN